MLRTLLAMALLCLPCTLLNAQHLSPLFGVLASHSPLQRPELFQKLQDELPDYLKSIEPGLRMPFLDDQFRDFESKLYTALNEIKIETKAEEIIIKVNDTTVCTIPWKPDSKPTIVIDSKILPKVVISSNIRMILWRIVNYIDNPILKKYAYIIRDSESNDLDTLIQEYLSKLFNSSEFKSIFPTPQDFKDYFEDFREKIIQAAHIAESEFNEVVAQASDYVVSGNIGLSLTSGEGAFAGGVLVGIKGKCGGIAGFTNLIGSSLTEEKKPGISQIGLRGYFQKENCEIDVFASSYLGSADSTKKDFSSWEVGVGISQRFGETLTVGIAGTGLFLEGQDFPLYNVGILFNGVSQYIPTFVVGAGYQEDANNDRLYPIFQIIQPINVR